MRTNWGGAPVGDVARTNYFDDRGEVYFTEWWQCPPGAANRPMAGTVVGIPARGHNGPGPAPIGDVARTDYYDDRGEVYFTEWWSCPPGAPGGAAAAVGPAEPDRWGAVAA